MRISDYPNVPSWDVEEFLQKQYIFYHSFWLRNITPNNIARAIFSKCLNLLFTNFLQISMETSLEILGVSFVPLFHMKMISATIACDVDVLICYDQHDSVVFFLSFASHNMPIQIIHKHFLQMSRKHKIPPYFWYPKNTNCTKKRYCRKNAQFLRQISSEIRERAILNVVIGRAVIWQCSNQNQFFGNLVKMANCIFSCILILIIKFQTYVFNEKISYNNLLAL